MLLGSRQKNCVGRWVHGVCKKVVLVQVSHRSLFPQPCSFKTFPPQKKTMSRKADFVVPESTLDRFALHMQFVFGDPEVRVENVENTCALLIKAAGNPDFTEEDRACLYRLSDLLHFAFTESYVTLDSVEGKKPYEGRSDMAGSCRRLHHECGQV